MTTYSYLSEAQWQSQVIQWAKAAGWRVMHDADSRRNPGDPGFPDLVLAKTGRALFIELKTEKGRQTPAQRDWEEDLPNYHLLRPSDLDELIALLET